MDKHYSQDCSVEASEGVASVRSVRVPGSTGARVHAHSIASGLTDSLQVGVPVVGVVGERSGRSALGGKSAVTVRSGSLGASSSESGGVRLLDPLDLVRGLLVCGLPDDCVSPLLVAYYDSLDKSTCGASSASAGVRPPSKKQLRTRKWEQDMALMPYVEGQCYLHAIKWGRRGHYLRTLGKSPSFAALLGLLQPGDVVEHVAREVGVYRVSAATYGSGLAYHVSYACAGGTYVGTFWDCVTSAVKAFPHVNSKGFAGLPDRALAMPLVGVVGATVRYTVYDGPGVPVFPRPEHDWFAEAADELMDTGVCLGPLVLSAPNVICGFSPTQQPYRDATYHVMREHMLLGFDPGGLVSFPGLDLSLLDGSALVVVPRGTRFYYWAPYGSTLGVSFRSLSDGEVTDLLDNMGQAAGTQCYSVFGASNYQGHRDISTMLGPGHHGLVKRQRHVLPLGTGTMLRFSVCGLGTVHVALPTEEHECDVVAALHGGFQMSVVAEEPVSVALHTLYDRMGVYVRYYSPGETGSHWRVPALLEGCPDIHSVQRLDEPRDGELPQGNFRTLGLAMYGTGGTTVNDEGVFIAGMD